MEEKFLPIGTVCRLKDATKYLMITGFCVKKEEEDKMYDYLGCIYPQGVVSTEVNFLFDHEQIEEIAFKGFVNDAEKSFKQQLIDLVSKTEPTINMDLIENSNKINNDSSVTQTNPLNSETNQQKEFQTNMQMFNTLNLNQQNDVNN